MKNKNSQIRNILTKKLSLKNNFYVENEFYYKTHKSRLDKIINHYEILKKIKNVKGEIVELGVFKGISLIRIAQIRDTLKIKKKIYGFDTFKDFPKTKKTNIYDTNFPRYFKKIIGSPIKKKKLEKILKQKKLKNIKIIQGNIFNTLKFIIRKKIKISLLHLDLDLEEATFYSLKLLMKNISKRGIVILDDYGIHPGIKRAVNKNLKKKKIFSPFYGKNPFYYIKD